jgi:(Z)-2-((N-methylformamido)methylene)-5-hydroxybutyrolactone dehydrogenase
MVVKPSDHTPVTALELAELVTEAGIPDGVFNVITGNGPAVGRALVRHPGVDKVAFTGSTKTGIDVAEGATSHLARVTLELGGKSAQVVFADADLEAAANGVIAGVFAATGQTCMAGSRLIVHEDVHDELIERVAARAREIVLGNPLEPATEMGPLANAQQFKKVTGILRAALEQGATAVCGGGPDMSLGGYFVQPTLLTDVAVDSPAVREEIFGPVVAVIPYDGEDDAVAIANDSDYGLSGSVWGPDAERAKDVARRIRSGNVAINQHRIDLAGPFGGFRQSGLGREYGLEGIDAYVELQSIPY